VSISGVLKCSDVDPQASKVQGNRRAARTGRVPA